MEATNTLELQADTLAGDVRDRMLDALRGMEKPWTDLREHEQRRRVDTVTGDARHLVNGAIDLIAGRGFTNVTSRTGKWSVKDSVIRLEVTITGSVENITALAEHGDGRAILVLADPDAFFGARGNVRVALDQPDMLAEAEEGASETTDAAVEAPTGEPADTPHDPETGEVLDPVAAENAKRLAAGIRPLPGEPVPESERQFTRTDAADAGEIPEHMDRRTKGRRKGRAGAKAEATGDAAAETMPDAPDASELERASS